MLTFPTALTSLAFQYPAARSLTVSTSVLTFLDGSEQRYQLSGSPLRTWTIRPALLAETILEQLMTFFELAGGSAGSFSFTDPLDQKEYPQCHFKEDAAAATFRFSGRTSLALTICESKV